jgi:hypothetical protein
MKRYAPRSREKLLERQGLNTVHHKIKTLQSAEEKRELISEHNPFLYIFGTQRLAQGHLEYADYLEKLGLKGGRRGR